MSLSVKMKKLKDYGIPSYIVNIWEKHYSRYLLPLQEEAVKKYGVLDTEEEMTGLPPSCLVFYREQKRKTALSGRDKNLLVIAPTCSGKTLIGEMAFIKKALHLQKTIYLTPSRTLAHEKYHHFKKLYSDCGMNFVISTRDRCETDHLIISGDYNVVVMTYEKFHYFCLQFPHFLDINSLVIIDEIQLIHDIKWGLLLEEMINCINRKNKNIQIIALSDYIEEKVNLLRWFPARLLFSGQRPVTLRKGIVRKGVFKFIASEKEKNCQKEIFFNPDAVRDNCFEDYLLETVRYLLKKDETILIFFATCAETRKWTRWLALHLKIPISANALKELEEMEETLSLDGLQETLEKGIAFYHQNLSREEKHLLERYIKAGRIKVICATNIMSVGINLHFDNVIIAMDKTHHDEGNYPPGYQTGLTFAAVENMAGRAGRIDFEGMEKYGNSFGFQNKQSFGRVIFLAHAMIYQAIYRNLYFNCLKNKKDCLKTGQPIIKVDDELPTCLLRLLANHKIKRERLKDYFMQEKDVSRKKQGSCVNKHPLSHYWQWTLKNGNIDRKIENALNFLKRSQLIKINQNGLLSPTGSALLVAAMRINAKTFLFFRTWLNQCKKGDISLLEIIFLLASSPDGKAITITFSPLIKEDYKKGIYRYGYRKNYWNQLMQLIFEQDDEKKTLFKENILFKKENESIATLKNYITFKKTYLLYEWVMNKRNIKDIEQEYGLHRSCIYRLGERFSKLAGCLAAMAESANWEKSAHEDLALIRMLSKRLLEGVTEEGLDLAMLYIPGLNRDHIKQLVKAGYQIEQSLRDASLDELSQLLPKSLVQRIRKKMTTKKNQQKFLDELQDWHNPICKTCQSPCPFNLNSGKMKASEIDGEPSKDVSENILKKPLLEISRCRPDRIIFMGKEIKMTNTGFSLLYLLAKHRGQVVDYEVILNELWADDEDAISHRLSYHISKIKKNILKVIKIKNKLKINQMIMAIKGRGLMLNLQEKELNIIP